jgi:hypothetical protein
VKKEITISTFNTNTEKWEKFGSVILSEDGVVSFEGMNEKAIREYYDHGAVGLAGGGVKFPKDGAAFLNALVLETNRTSFVRAILPDRTGRRTRRRPS